MNKVHMPVIGQATPIQPIFRWALATARQRATLATLVTRDKIPMLTGRMRALQLLTDEMGSAGRETSPVQAAERVALGFATIATFLELADKSGLTKLGKDIFDASDTQTILLARSGLDQLISGDRPLFSRDQLTDIITYSAPMTGPAGSQREVVDVLSRWARSEVFFSGTNLEPLVPGSYGWGGAYAMAFVTRLLEMGTSEMAIGPSTTGADGTLTPTARAGQLRSIAGGLIAAAHCAATDVLEYQVAFLNSDWAQTAAVGRPSEQLMKLLAHLDLRESPRQGFAAWSIKGAVLEYDVLKAWIDQLPCSDVTITGRPEGTPGRSNPLMAELHQDAALTVQALSNLVDETWDTAKEVQRLYNVYTIVVSASSGPVVVAASAPTVIPEYLWGADLVTPTPLGDFTYPVFPIASQNNVFWGTEQATLMELGLSSWDMQTFQGLRQTVDQPTFEVQATKAKYGRDLLHVPLVISGGQSMETDVASRQLMPVFSPFESGEVYYQPSLEHLHRALGMSSLEWSAYIGQLSDRPGGMGLRSLAQLLRFVGIVYVKANGGTPIAVLPYQRHWYHADGYLPTGGCLSEGFSLGAARRPPEDGIGAPRQVEILLRPFSHLPASADITTMSNNLIRIARDEERTKKPLMLWLAKDADPRPLTRIYGWRISDKGVFDIIAIPPTFTDVRFVAKAEDGQFHPIAGVGGWRVDAPQWTYKSNFIFSMDDAPTPSVSLPGVTLEFPIMW